MNILQRKKEKTNNSERNELDFFHLKHQRKNKVEKKHRDEVKFSRLKGKKKA